MSFQIQSLEDRIRFKVQVVLMDTAEFLGLRPSDPQSKRCRYVENLLLNIDFPIGRMPWELPLNAYDLPQVEMQDVSSFYEELLHGLRETRYMGEELFVSPSKGTWLLIHFYKGQS